MFRNATLTVMFFSIVLAACSGGGGSSAGGGPSPVPTTTVNGVASDGILRGSTISVYAFDTGAKGSLLGTSTTNNKGEFTVSLKSETTPVLIEATGGRYIEETSGVNITLQPGQVLSAVAIHSTGANFSANITAYTHLAAALAKYRISHGFSITSAIQTANNDVSNYIGFDVLATTPYDVTDAVNASAFASPNHEYGFLSAAVSSLTAYIGQISGTTVHTTHTSIGFYQVMYQDMLGDGLLNGLTPNGAGGTTALSYGSLPLNQTVYRYAIAAHVLDFTNTTNNRTTLGTAQTGQLTQRIAASTAGFFGVEPPIPLSTGNTQVSFTSPQNMSWQRANFTVAAAVNDVVPVVEAILFVDNSSYATAVDPQNPSFLISNTLFSEGTHTFSLRTTNAVGIRTTSAINVGLDRTGVVVTSSAVVENCGGRGLRIAGTTSDVSGIASLHTLTSNGTVSPDGSFSLWVPYEEYIALGLLTYVVYVFTDNAGNVKNYVLNYNTNDCGYLVPQ